MCAKKKKQELARILNKCKGLAEKYDESYSQCVQINISPRDNETLEAISEIQDALPKVANIVMCNRESVEPGKELLQMIDAYIGKGNKSVKKAAEPLRQALDISRIENSEQPNEAGADTTKKSTGVWQIFTRYIENNVNGNADLFLGIGEWGIKVIVAVSVVFAYLTNYIAYQYDLAFYATGFGVPQSYIAKSSGASDFVIQTIIYMVVLLLISIPLFWMMNDIDKYKADHKKQVKRINIATAAITIVLIFVEYLFIARAMPTPDSQKYVLALTILCAIFSFILVFFLNRFAILLHHNAIYVVLFLVVLAIAILYFLCPPIKDFIIGFTNAIDQKNLSMATIGLIIFLVLPTVFLTTVYTIAKKDKTAGFVTIILFSVGVVITILLTYTIKQQGINDYTTQLHNLRVFSITENKEQTYAVVYETEDRMIAFACIVNEEEKTITKLDDDSHIIISGEDVVFTSYQYTPPQDTTDQSP